jgi:hypothetical protein
VRARNAVNGQSVVFLPPANGFFVAAKKIGDFLPGFQAATGVVHGG